MIELEEDDIKFLGERAQHYASEMAELLTTFQHISTLSEIVQAKKVIRNFMYSLLALQNVGAVFDLDSLTYISELVGNVETHLASLLDLSDMEPGPEIRALRDEKDLVNEEDLFNFLEPADTYEEWEAWQEKRYKPRTIN